MKRVGLVAFIFLFSIASYCQRTTAVTIDLTAKNDNSIPVTLRPPLSPENEKHVLFFRPALFLSDEEFIRNFTAYDTEGKKLEVVHKKNDEFIIRNADALAEIQYLVQSEKDFEFQPGQNIIRNKEVYVLMPSSVIGFVKEDGDVNYDVKIRHPENLSVITPISSATTGKNNTHLQNSTYRELSDNIFFIAPADTASWTQKGHTLFLSVFSPAHAYSAEKLMPLIAQVFTAAASYFPNDFTGSYHVMLYLGTQQTSSPVNAMDYGGLNHSSVIYAAVPLGNDSAENIAHISDILMHEFFHELIPDHLYSEKTFSPGADVYSKHLWFYEGVTEYLSKLTQLRDSLCSEDMFMDELSEMIRDVNEEKSVSLTDASENIFRGKNAKYYPLFYSKGCLAAFLLDIRMKELSGGRSGLYDVLKKMMREYHNTSFPDDSLFAILAGYNPPVMQFLQTYVSGTEDLPFREYFEKIGWRYRQQHSESIYTFGDFALRPDEKTKEIKFENVRFTSFQAQTGDILLRVNDIEVVPENVEDIYNKLITADENDHVLVMVRRNKKDILLQGKSVKAVKVSSGFIREIPFATEEEVKLRNAVLFGS